MERPRRRPEPAAIDISWVSCRGVRSTLPFHTPCLYASVFVAPSSAKGVHGHRRPHRVKTPTDRAGGANPEWDAPLRLYLPADASPSPSPPLSPAEAGKDNSKDGGDDDVLLLRFELKAEVAVLGDKLAASAAVPVPGLVADGRTRRVSYQLAGPDGKQPNGVISFSYAFRQSNGGGGDDANVVATPPSPATPTTPAADCPPAPSPTAAPPRLYPAIDQWPLEAEQIPIYPPVAAAEAAATLTSSPYYYPPPPPATRLEPPVPVYPPSPEATTSPCGVYPPSGEAVAASGMYPTVDLAPVSCWYPPAAPALCGYAAAPGWDDRRLYS